MEIMEDWLQRLRSASFHFSSRILIQGCSINIPLWAVLNLNNRNDLGTTVLDVCNIAASEATKMQWSSVSPLAEYHVKLGGTLHEVCKKKLSAKIHDLADTTRSKKTRTGDGKTTTPIHKFPISPSSYCHPRKIRVVASVQGNR